MSLPLNLQIRPECQADWVVIGEINRLAFGTTGEAQLVDALRRSGRLSLSLVAVLAQAVVAHVAFSPVTISSAHRSAVGLGLAPVSVRPDLQRRGIGDALIRAGLGRCQEAGMGFVVLLGHPHYYHRFGFKAASEFGVGNEYGAQEEFMALEFVAGAARVPDGIARYSPEFSLVS